MLSSTSSRNMQLEWKAIQITPSTIYKTEAAVALNSGSLNKMSCLSISYLSLHQSNNPHNRIHMDNRIGLLRLPRYVMHANYFSKKMIFLFLICYNST